VTEHPDEIAEENHTVLQPRFESDISEYKSTIVTGRDNLVK